MQKFTRKSTQFTKVMRVMETPSNTQMMFYTGNSADNSLEDTEDTHQEDREEDSLNNKDLKVSREIKVTKVILISNKVTKGIHKDNVETSEVKATSEASTDLVTHWILAIMS